MGGVHQKKRGRVISGVCSKERVGSQSELMLKEGPRDLPGDD